MSSPSLMLMTETCIKYVYSDITTVNLVNCRAHVLLYERKFEHVAGVTVRLAGAEGPVFPRESSATSLQQQRLL